MSVQTFRGHTVLQTLIRAYFSPAHSTGQRFVYTGSADGTVRIYGERPLVKVLTWLVPKMYPLPASNASTPSAALGSKLQARALTHW